MKIEVSKTDTKRIAQLCVGLAGGGMTVKQTAKAMDYQSRLLENGKLTVRSTTIMLVD